MRQYSTHRTQEQWQSLIDQWRDSGLSAVRFCEEQAIGYASFCKWRKRLADELPVNSEQTGTQDDHNAFIDLGALAAKSSAPGWSIVLSLGEGVELRLSRP